MGSPSHDAFSLLHPSIQQRIWDMGWDDLRPIQISSIHALLQSEADLVIAADTAGGKTEAAFLPILSAICPDPSGSVRAMYVGPLKALINDQFSRLEDLCRRAAIPVHRWHGDVGASHKAKLIEEPGGVLLITPESLESLFVNKGEHLEHLFGNLDFIVIDELHAFLGDPRGLHLRSLLSRLQQYCSTRVRLVGLSATIGDFDVARGFLDRDDPDGVTLIRDEGPPSEVRFGIQVFREVKSEEEADEEQGTSDEVLAGAIVKHCRGQTNLVFCNARRDVELLGSLCADIAGEEGLADRFLVHHGSLAHDIREEAEAHMQADDNVTTLCSSTLEMGIDIGDVRAVGQVGPPWSVASLKQRLGRSGRRPGATRIMRLYVRAHDPGDDPIAQLHAPLLQAIAAADLMFSHWCEPDIVARCDLSTLVQQIMSVIAHTGGRPADVLYETLCERGPFNAIEPPLFARVLRDLGSKDVIEQMGTGDLILGLEGEQLRKARDFYAVFQSPPEYHVVTGGRRIGTMSLLGSPRLGNEFVLAGRRWRIATVDESRRELLVQPGTSAEAPLFRGSPGETHARIRQRMREILCERTLGHGAWDALDEPGRAAVNEARAAWNDASLESDDFIEGGSSTLWMTWTGTRAQRTLIAALSLLGVHAGDRGIALSLGCSVNEARSLAERIDPLLDDPERIAAHVHPKVVGCHDHLLSDEVLNVSIARDRLDVAGACEVLARL